MPHIKSTHCGFDGVQHNPLENSVGDSVLASDRAKNLKAKDLVGAEDGDENVPVGNKRKRPPRSVMPMTPLRQSNRRATIG